MSEKKKELSIEERVMALEKIVSDIAAWRRKASANWKNFCAKFVGASAEDGKLSDTRDGRTGVLALAGVFCMAVLVSAIVVLAGASDLGSDPTDLQNYIKFRVDKDGSTSIASNLIVWGSVQLNGRTVISNATIATTDVVVANSITAGGIISSPAVSNAVGLVYASNLNIKAGGTVTVPAGSVASASIAAGTMANRMIVSNIQNVVVASNIVAVAGGTVALQGTTTFSLAPVLTATNAAGAFLMPVAPNAPTMVASNSPVWFQFKVGSVTYTVPAYAMP